MSVRGLACQVNACCFSAAQLDPIFRRLVLQNRQPLVQRKRTVSLFALGY